MLAKMSLIYCSQTKKTEVVSGEPCHLKMSWDTENRNASCFYAKVSFASAMMFSQGILCWQRFPALKLQRQPFKVNSFLNLVIGQVKYI